MPESCVSSYHRFLQKDPQALEELIRTYSDALVRYAYSYVRDSAAAEDVMEETFAAVFLRKKMLSGPEKLRAYLFAVARNKSIDYLRRHRNEVPLCDVENVLSVPDAEEDLIRRERIRTVYAYLQRLPAQYREVLELNYLEDFSVEQICTIMGKRPKQVYNLLQRARVTLRELLEKEGITREDLS